MWPMMIAELNECMSRELAVGNWPAYTILAALYRDLIAIKTSSDGDAQQRKRYE